MYSFNPRENLHEEHSALREVEASRTSLERVTVLPKVHSIFVRDKRRDIVLSEFNNPLPFFTEPTLVVVKITPGYTSAVLVPTIKRLI